MVKLDAQVLRYMTKDEFRVLTAVEMGMKNHDLVPTPLICRIAGLKKGGALKMINHLHRNKLIVHESKKYDGYKLTYLGYDYLALKVFVQRGHISGIGSRFGVGKESDIYEVVNAEGVSMALKIHRLGRVSFRNIKSKRDYLGKRKGASFLYMARLAATREYAYMKALYEHDFPVPTPIDQNRHCVLMSKVDAFPFGQVRKLERPGLVFGTLMDLVVRLAEHGLIHCDFNEFNLMIDKNEKITLIDFPQMVSTSHENADFYFDRDIECVITYFLKRFKFRVDERPSFSNDTDRLIDLDVELAASGVSKAELKAFESYMRHKGEDDDDDDGEYDEGEEVGEGDDDEEVEEESGEEGDGLEQEEGGEATESANIASDTSVAQEVGVEQASLVSSGEAKAAASKCDIKNDNDNNEDDNDNNRASARGSSDNSGEGDSSDEDENEGEDEDEGGDHSNKNDNNKNNARGKARGKARRGNGRPGSKQVHKRVLRQFRAKQEMKVASGGNEYKRNTQKTNTMSKGLNKEKRKIKEQMSYEY